MKIGVNWSGQRELPVLKDLLFRNDIDFIEILIDNFLHTDTDSINRIIDGRDCSFHIMNSQFLHKTISDLKNISNLITLTILESNYSDNDFMVGFLMNYEDNLKTTSVNKY